MNAKESLVLFRVPHGILEPCQNLYIEGGRLLDAGLTWKSYEGSLCEVEVAGGIATCGGDRVPEVVVKLKQLGAQELSKLWYRMIKYKGELAFVIA